LNADAVITAYYPLLDEKGLPNIGKNAKDRPYLPELKTKLKPMLTEVLIGRTGGAVPVVLMLAPLIVEGRFEGYTVIVPKLAQIREFLDLNMDGEGMRYTLLDKNGNVIMSNRADIEVMQPFSRGKGTLTILDADISQWIPDLPSNTSIMERWRHSLYVSESPIGSLSEWKLILEQPVAPFQKHLYDRYSKILFFVFLILLTTLALAGLLSRRATRTLESLAKATADLPVKLTRDDGAPTLPQSNVLEIDNLIGNFRAMSEALAIQFRAVRQINESLEEQVERRTQQLRENGERLEKEMLRRSVSEKALSESEARFRILFEQAPVGIFISDLKGSYRQVNQKLCDILGYARDELIQMSFVEVTHPNDQDHDREVFQDLLSGKAVLAVDQKQYVRKDRSSIWCRRSAALTFTESGEPNFLVGVVENIEDQVRAQELRDQIERTIQHDLRKPAANALHIAELLKTDSSLDEDHRMLLGLFEKAGEEMIATLDMSLTVYKIETGQYEAKPVEFNVYPLVRDLNESLTHSTGAAKIEIELAGLEEDNSNPIYMCRGELGLLRSALHNILVNALEASPRDGKVSVKLSDGSQCRIEVRNRGSVPREVRERFFDKYVTSGKKTGSGIGTYSAKMLVEAQGGHIEMTTSDETDETTVTIVMPT